jgi:hypothetical protein
LISIDSKVASFSPRRSPLILANPVKQSTSISTPAKQFHRVTSNYCIWSLRVDAWWVGHEVFVNQESDHHWTVIHEFLHNCCMRCLHFQRVLLASILLILNCVIRAFICALSCYSIERSVWQAVKSDNPCSHHIVYNSWEPAAIAPWVAHITAYWILLGERNFYLLIAMDAESVLKESCWSKRPAWSTASLVPNAVHTVRPLSPRIKTLREIQSLDNVQSLGLLKWTNLRFVFLLLSVPVS